jgi:hypothetical protein
LASGLTAPEAKARVVELTEKALRQAGLLETVFALVRVEGFAFGPDLLDEQLTALEDGPTEAQARYWLIATNLEQLRLLLNLARCAAQEPFDPYPFGSVGGTDEPQGRFVHDAALATRNALLAVDESELAELVATAYSPQVLNPEEAEGGASAAPVVSQALRALETLTRAIIEAQKEARRRFVGQQLLFKLPQFEVLELLVGEADGLYGFRVHFSNGSTAHFERHLDRTDALNIMLSCPLNFMVGGLDDLRHEWLVGGKPLYEIGLPGRYNRPGEWKPIIFPGDPQPLLTRVRSLSDDPEVQGALFYVMATGHRVIEFVVRTALELPSTYAGLGERLELFKCPSDAAGLGGNIRIYDGTFTLDSIDPDEVRRAIATIGVGVNRFAFAYGAAVDWRTKYSTQVRTAALAQPSKDDLDLLDSLLKDFPATTDAVVLDAAIDWFNRGRSSRNVFVSFLAFYIAFESVASAIADGKVDLGVRYNRMSKAERLEQRARCIRAKHDALYNVDSVRFVSEAYFECVHTLKAKSRAVAELVFGAEHPAVSALFERATEPSLSDIRSALAHGTYTLLDVEHEHLVRRRLPEVEDIAREFLTRLIFQLEPSTRIPSWTQEHGFAMSMADPRNTLYATQESILPTKEWPIRPEWCD